MALVLAAPARAIQFTPDGDDRLNEFQSGDPGTPFETAPDGVDYDGVGSGDPHPGEVVVDGTIPILRYFDGSAQATFDFNTDGTDPIAFALEAELLSAALAPVGGGDVQFVATFQGTDDGQPDLVLTDPSDGTILLESDLVSGVLNGSSVAPITVLSAPFDPNSPPSDPALQGFAFFQTILGNSRPWEILFSDDVGTLQDEGVAQTLISNFMPSFATIASELDTTGDLPSLTAEANGTIFGLDSSQFVVPEPGTAWLLGGALAMLAATRRRRGA